MNEERRRILKMLEDGSITAEEADELLSNLDHHPKEENTYSISEQVQWEQSSNYQDRDDSQEKRRSTKHKIFDFVDDAFKKIKKIDLDFNFGSAVEVSHIFQFSNPFFQSLNFDVENGSFDIYSWDEKEVRVECKAKVYKVDNQDEAKIELFEQLVVDMKNDKFLVKLPTKKIKAEFTIYLPNKILQQSEIHTFNGAINLTELESKELKVKTSNGKIQLDKVKGEEWEVKAANSHIKVENSVCSDCEVEAMNGSIFLDGTFVKVDAQVVTGSIHCNWYGMAGRTGFFKTTTGSIYVHVPENKKIDGELKSSLGSVTCNIPEYETVKSAKDFLKKQLHFHTKGTNDAPLFIDAETKTGSIFINSL